MRKEVRVGTGASRTGIRAHPDKFNLTSKAISHASVSPSRRQPSWLHMGTEAMCPAATPGDMIDCQRAPHHQSGQCRGLGERPRSRVQNIWDQGGKQVMGLGTHRWGPWLLWLALNSTLKPQDVKFPNLLCKLPFKIIGHLLIKNRQKKNRTAILLLLFCSKKPPALLRTPKHNTISPVCFLFSSPPPYLPPACHWVWGSYHGPPKMHPPTAKVGGGGEIKKTETRGKRKTFQSLAMTFT